ncbi:NAD(P) transhydrogenase subunit alpha [Pseudomonadales bacterium]|jgi:NAD(P) transhydrogenase subunit alpha|nr:NAD(P) transhydrogenase subunit alpha [Pseudomonadales bacterium]MDB4430796.1 NAD(P) transhydrogenase subunit alpha [Pseudomonadales bacterium]MDB4542055.1 NAD(P) transhydrogenase subunit alpha [Pseudomonadales bacterium]MDB4806573.1 NAD(P) transhydrogenase subunit alpha [Pseudomonadales bacterium]
MLIAIPKETAYGEKRAALIPASVKKLVQIGAQVSVESGLGAAAGFSDKEYQAAGASLVDDRSALLASAQMVLRVRKPELADIELLQPGCIHVSFLDPFNETAIIDAMRERNISAISMEMIPRSTRSQKMDALSSQANLAGYVMALKAATYLPSILPMMMTPAGTLKPAKVFVIGAGVAGLQAIATAKRLGAQVTAFDTRSEVAEQVHSVGAKFLEIDLGETGSTKDGYAKELTAEQLQIQREAQKEVIANSDAVITTAQVFGRKPPVIVPKEFVAGMRAGSVVIDMAAETGGNVEGSVPGEVVSVNGVNIVGTGNWPNEVARDASQMYSSNLYNLVEEFWSKDEQKVVLDFENDLIGCVITHQQEIVNQVIANLRSGGG